MSQSLRYKLDREAEKAGAKFSIPRWGDSGYDLYASQAVTIFKGEQMLVPTGLKLEIPHGLVGIIKDRSSMALRRLYTHGGVIDSGFRGEVTILLENRSNTNYHIEPGERVAQMLFLCNNATLIPFKEELEELSDSARGEGSFGSTGK